MWCNQIFSLIDSNGIIQNVIVADNYQVANELAVSMYGDNSYAMDTTQFPLGIGCKCINGLFFEKDGITEIPRSLTADEEANLARLKADTLDKQLNPTIDVKTCTLDELKNWQINLSKNNLVSYLESNPITSTCHGSKAKRYAITKDKQKYLSQMIIVTQMAKQAGQEYAPSWNATGEACTYDWTLEELQQLAFEIDTVVRPLISHQQNMEVEINAAETKEAIIAISLEF